MGVRPSLDCRDDDAENCRRAAGALVARAGTRNAGSVAIGEAPHIATLEAAAGASMVAKWVADGRAKNSLSTNYFHATDWLMRFAAMRELEN